MWKVSIWWFQQQQRCINLHIFTILGPASPLRSRIMQLWVSSLECPCESHPPGGSSTLMYLKLDSLLLIPPQNSFVFSCVSWFSGFLTFRVSQARHGGVIARVSPDSVVSSPSQSPRLDTVGSSLMCPWPFQLVTKQCRFFLRTISQPQHRLFTPTTLVPAHQLFPRWVVSGPFGLPVYLIFTTFSCDRNMKKSTSLSISLPY